MVLKITNLHILRYLSTYWLYLLECYTIDNQQCTHTVEENAYYLMDKGYVKFDSLYNHFHLNHGWFVTRAKDNMLFEVVESREVDHQTGLISDETIRLTGYYTSRKYPDNLRLVVYEDFRDGKVYRFLTNKFTVDAITIAELYRERWQVEIFFKWIKQHLHIKTFYGTSRNAVYTQIWIAICDYLLLIIKISLILSGRFYSKEVMSETFITNQMCRLVFRRSALLVNFPYGKISPDSNDIVHFKLVFLFTIISFLSVHRLLH